MSEQLLTLPEEEVAEAATVKSLAEKIREPNLADDIDKDTLDKIARQVIEDFQTDKESMKDWIDFIDKGKQLAEQEIRGKSEPWENSANFKSPVLLNASLRFGDRASMTLLKGRDLVKIDVIGKSDEEKTERAQRIKTHMNYQLNHTMIEWRDDHDTLLYALGSDGCLFKTTFFDAGKGRNVSEIIRYPDFVVNQSVKHIENALSFTIIREFVESDIIAKQREGIWLEIPIKPEDKPDPEPDPDNETPSDGTFYEQHMFYDLDEDDYVEPYIATVHVSSETVVRLVPRYEEDNIVIKNGDDVLRLDKALERDIKLDEMELVRIEPVNSLTKYGFIPSIDGTFLNIGYFHLLASITNAINNSTNHMVNAGMLQTSKTTFLAKNFRKKKGELRLKIGKMNQTDMTAADLQNGIKVVDFGEPSAVLLQLTAAFQVSAEQLSASADLTEAIGANAPATTMLGLIQEQMIPISALVRRIYRAEGKEFQKLYQLNGKFTDPDEYKEVLDDDEAEFREDYERKSMDVIPAANPEMTSRVQRLIQAQIMLEQFDRVLQSGGNPIPILKEFFEVVGSENIEEIFPEEPPEDDPNLQALQQAQQQTLEIASQQIAILRGQLENQEAKTVIEKQKADDNTQKVAAEIKEILSEVVLNLEKAETEDSKNQNDQYTQNIDTVRKLIETADNINANRQLVGQAQRPAQ